MLPTGFVKPEVKGLAMNSPSLTRCPTGVDGLDDILGGGLPPNRFYLIHGEPGSGKTTLALQFLLQGAKRGERGLYITLSETRDELEAVAESHGWDLSDLAIFELSSISEQLAIESQNTLFHPSEVELNQTTKLLLAEVERVSPRLVVFDSLSEMRILAQNSLRYRRQMLAFKQFFSQHQCTVLMLDDKTGDISDVSSIAHGVISMEMTPSNYGMDHRRLSVRKMRGTQFPSGNHDYLIKRGGLEVFPRLIAAESRGGNQRAQCRSGIPEFDTLLGGGLDLGSTTLFMGPAGSGKSSLVMRVAVEAAKRGERVVYYAFDETVDSLKHRSTATGMDLQKHLDNGTITIVQVDPAELSPGEFSHRIRRSVEENRVAVVVIDSLNGYMHAMPEARSLVLQLHELLTFLNQKGVMTMMVSAQAGLVGSMHSPIDLTYLADTVVLFRFFEAIGVVRRAISVIKKRRSGHEKTIREFLIEANGLRVGKPLTEFQGILTGVPTFVGATDSVMDNS